MKDRDHLEAVCVEAVCVELRDEELAEVSGGGLGSVGGPAVAFNTYAQTNGSLTYR